MRLTSRYSLLPHGPKRLEVIRNWSWTDVLVRFDAMEVGRTSEDELKDGVEYELRDGSQLRLWMKRGPRNTPFLYITRNGHPLPGSEGDPVKILRETLLIICVIAGLQTTFAGIVISNGRDDTSIDTMFGLGILLLLLCFLAWRRSLPAMVFAGTLCFAEVVLTVATQAHWDIGSVFPLLFALSITAWLMYRGVAAVRDLNSRRLPIRRPPE